MTDENRPAAETSLRAAPYPLSRAQWIIFGVLSVVIAATRFLAVARSLWDWDEANFAMALQEYDVAQHTPHPPGAPSFVFLAQLAHLFIDNEFRAVQTVTVIASLALFPAAFYLLRELRFAFVPAAGGAAVLAFMPNVWFFGGTGFSDVAGLVITLAALGTMLRGCRSRHAYWIGSALLAFVMGMRPQVFLLGLAIGLIATWYRRRKPLDIAIAAAIGFTIVALAYGAAAYFTGFERYTAQLDSVKNYVDTIDSYRNPDRPKLGALFETFIVHPYGYRKMAYALIALAFVSLTAGIVRRRPAPWIILGTYLPLAIVSWFLLDYNSTSRYSLAYVPMQAFLAADAIAVIFGWLRQKRIATALQLICFAVILGALIRWTAPALTAVRNEASPPVQAIDWIRTQTTPADVISFDLGLIPHASYLLPDREKSFVAGTSKAPVPAGRRAYFSGEGTVEEEGAVHFRREHGNLFEIARKRYFTVHVLPLHLAPVYLEGWYQPEEINGDVWRWMAYRGTIQLPPFEKGGQLTLAFNVPITDPARRPVITARANGTVIDQFTVPGPDVHRTITIGPSAEPIVFALETDQVFNPKAAGVADDSRDLGLQLQSTRWIALDKSPGEISWGDGFYAPEGTPPDVWRWMQGRGVITLSPLAAEGVMTIDFVPPRDVSKGDPPSLVTVTIGAEKHQFEVPGRLTKSFDVAASSTPVTVTIETNRVVNPAREGLAADSRDLGLQVFGVTWNRK